MKDFSSGVEAENIIARVTYPSVYADTKKTAQIIKEFDNVDDVTKAACKNFVGDFNEIAANYEAYLNLYGGKVLLSPNY